MKVVFDIEANALVNPTQIWLIVCKDIDTGETYTFRNLTSNDTERTKFLNFTSSVTQWIGHNVLGYDCIAMRSLLQVDIASKSLDTLILSKLIDYPRKGHSIESYGEEFGSSKGSFHKWNDPSLYDPDSELFKELETYCIRDVDIGHRVYLKYLKYISKKEHLPSITLEHSFQLVVNNLSNNGFKFNIRKAEGLLQDVTAQLLTLDAEIEKAFPPRLTLVREITPKYTKHGTLSKSDFRFVKDGDLSIYNGGPFCLCTWKAFNPSSHKQIVSLLTSSGWKPINKTQTHIDTERELQSLKRPRSGATAVDIEDVSAKLVSLGRTGWKVDEDNLETLPATAPTATRSLAKRILLESRRRTLTEWLALVKEDGRVHGKFFGLGAWTHRMAHREPNTANIPNELDTQGNVKLLGKEMRQLWQSPKNRLLVGVDAEGIQLRIFAHYINDGEFTDALVRGKKSDKTDPHSFNQRILGSVCRSRQAAKRFIYALLLGAGLQKLSAILECSDRETKEALDRLMDRYTGWQRLKDEVFPKDAARGYLIGLDDRRIRIPGETEGNRKHLCMSGYLQSGEAIVMKLATIEWMERLEKLRLEYPKLDYKLVNFVHDEWQTEVNNNMELAILVAKEQCDSLRVVGESLNLNCPLAGSYWNDDHHDYTIGTNWYQTH